MTTRVSPDNNDRNHQDSIKDWLIEILLKAICCHNNDDDKWLIAKGLLDKDRDTWAKRQSNK